MTGGFEPLHAPLALPRRPMGVLTPVVERAALAMFHSGEYLALGGPVAFELIRDEHPWHVRELLEQLAEELLRGAFVPPTLHEDIEDIPILIDGAPQIVALTMDRQKHLIERLCIPRSRTPMSHSSLASCCPNLTHRWRMASYVTMTPRAKNRSSTLRSLKQKRQYHHTAWLMILAGNR
jgi:hypothetical protein